ncbi:dephospho-CoA kinase [Aeromonas rivuli]|jgi:dephospho-CoA kinase|uniref:dephospho-CoA kinase n=1 Tax=Aeromonas rivuli TaxID=648794 RepID=UPI0005A5D1D6|nr:dephospho-CoA kinase [Aeromonas rivuli]UBO74506.1 dephospho-CoA kinase [Aeromonas rivuli]
MYIVAITGGIGSGKTTVANLFGELGIDIIDADVIAREVVEPGTPALAAITQHFGVGVLDEEGALDRRKLRDRVFREPDAKGWLNALLHPLIRQEMQRQCAEASSPYCLLVVPLLVENRLTAMANRVLVVDVDEETQITRTCRRDGVSREQARAIVTAQASRMARLAAADDIIENRDGSPELLRGRILALHQTYLTFATQQARQL